MLFAWLKRFSPRGLYGRAALILILPVVTLQLVVSVVFIQRHFEGVTRQMTFTASREVQLLLQDILPAPDQQQALERVAGVASLLQIGVRFDATDSPPEFVRRWYDLSGLAVISTFASVVPNIAAVQLPDDGNVVLFLQVPQGMLELTLDRRRVAPSNPHQLFVNMVFFGVLMTLIAFLYMRNQLRPITRLAKAAEAFGRGRNVEYRPAGAVEVRAAGNAFLDMRARIERQIEQRTLMLSGVSHDLRTPLTRLKLGLSMLDDEDTADLLREFLPAFGVEVGDDDPGALGGQLAGRGRTDAGRATGDDCASSIDIHVDRLSPAATLPTSGLARRLEVLDHPDHRRHEDGDEQQRHQAGDLEPGALQVAEQNTCRRQEEPPEQEDPDGTAVAGTRGDLVVFVDMVLVDIVLTDMVLVDIVAEVIGRVGLAHTGQRRQFSARPASPRPRGHRADSSCTRRSPWPPRPCC